MSKEKNVIEYYVLCNKLKNLIRTGWKDWSVNKDRLESVAEHVYGVQMLAIAMYLEYDYKDLDIRKVIFMLAIHELGETIIGDLTPFQITRKEKEEIEHEAVHRILSKFVNGNEIENLFLEFDNHLTKEAKFAYQCDKLECDLQCKIYDEQGGVNITDLKENIALDNNRVKELLEKGYSWSRMWMEFSQEKYPYDDNFRSVSNYAINNDITSINIGKGEENI